MQAVLHCHQHMNSSAKPCQGCCMKHMNLDARTLPWHQDSNSTNNAAVADCCWVAVIKTIEAETLTSQQCCSSQNATLLPCPPRQQLLPCRTSAGPKGSTAAAAICMGGLDCCTAAGSSSSWLPNARYMRCSCSPVTLRSRCSVPADALSGPMLVPATATVVLSSWLCSCASILLCCKGGSCRPWSAGSRLLCMCCCCCW
ncbi:hypothetical protein COO60DRAFT_1603347 [Scenedesmus sp. NREL 46B-D3]|nr:hypothetical protein COO60DRAFT_1603347 [Scenedesmus sp. NREL 46B-D3]